MASALSAIHATSGGARRQLMFTVTALSLAQPKRTSKYSKPFLSRNATRSSDPTPAAASALATRFDRSSSSAHVWRKSPSGPGWTMASLSPRSLAWVRITSAVLAMVPIGPPGSAVLEGPSFAANPPAPARRRPRCCSGDRRPARPAARRQGLDLGPRPGVSRVRVRHGHRRTGGSGGDDPGQRLGLAWRAEPARRARADRHTTAGRRSSTPATSATSSASTSTASTACSPRTDPTTRTGTRTPPQSPSATTWRRRRPSRPSSRWPLPRWPTASTRRRGPVAAHRLPQRRRGVHRRDLRPLPDPRSRPPSVGRGGGPAPMTVADGGVTVGP